VFTTDTPRFAPEIFSRLGGEIYIAGLNDSSIPLPVLATETIPLDEAVRQLQEVAARLVVADDDDKLEVVRKGLCFRPVVSTRATPVIGRVSDLKLGGGLRTREGGEGGVFVGAGHGPWGISLSLGTGKVLAEMVEGRDTSVDVRQLTW
jgi:glycine/D-amino acid oxidase-like deaminating enzyme